MSYKSTYREEKQERKAPDLGSVDEVQQKLYAKNNTITPYERKGFSTVSEEVPLSWKDIKNAEKNVDLVEKNKVKKPRKPITFFTKVFVASLLFFAFSVMAAFMVFFYGQNEVSYDAVNLSVLGPNSVAGGDTLSFDVTVFNDNPVPMVLTDVVVNYPTGTITADGQNLPLQKDIKSIDEIRSGFQDTVKFEALIFGKEGETKEITIVFQYRVPDSDNIFFKERVYQIAVESAPVVISGRHELTYQSGDEMIITVDATSNAVQAIDNLLLTVDYPFGFEFASSSVAGIDESSFAIGTLQPGESQEIIIRGTIVGQDNEERTLRYALGMQDSNRLGVIGSEFVSSQSNLTIVKPPVSLDLLVNNDASILYNAGTDEDLRFVLEYGNVLASRLVDVEITARLSGLVYDRKTVNSTNGFYRSNDDSVSWSQTEVNQLANLESGQKGELGFQLRTNATSQLAGLVQNPELIIDVQAEATNFEEGGNERTITSTTKKRIKLETDLAIAQTLLYSVGPLENSGPIQPTIGRDTTYSVRWQLSNSTNKVEQAIVTAELPAYVSFQNIVAPADKAVTFDPRTRTVTWLADEITPGAGYSTPAEEVYFTVQFEPSLGQLNTIPVLVEDVSVVGSDTFTSTQVGAEAFRLNTLLTQDPDFREGSARVKE